jgi:outer membrane receptor for ferrienterochelin and colicins
MKFIHKIIFFLLFGFHLEAQQVVIWNQDTDSPVRDCYVYIEDAKGVEQHLISDADGKIFADQTELPVVIFVQHLNFEPLETTLNSWPERIQLKEKAFTLDEMVVTGQYEARTMSASTFQVKAIDRATIDLAGTGNISEVLQFIPGLDIQRDPSLSSQSLRLIGMGGNNTKILLDGIPINGRTGSDFDISQLNVHNIDRIEIIEGPMSTEYGSNALAGVVNIITKKNIQDRMRIDLQILEETVGDQYGFSEGIHDYSMNGGFTLNSSTDLLAWGGRRNFGGAQVLLTGRAMDWDPKEQWHAGAMLKKRVGQSQLSIRSEWFDEVIHNAGNIFGSFDQRAMDEYYHSNRLLNHLDFGTYIQKLGRLDVKASVSWYQRIKNSYIENLKTNESIISTADGSQDSSYFMAYNLRANLTKQISDQVKIRYGTDILYDLAWGGRVEGDDKKDALDAGLFGSFEWSPSDKIRIQPGMRWSYNSRYPAPIIPSLNLKYSVLPDLTFRAGYAKGFRAPALRELYFNFVDSSHKIYGNEDLKAEKSTYWQGALTWFKKESGQHEWQIELSGFLNSATDQINYATDPNDATATTLINIDEVKTNGLRLESRLAKSTYNLSAGVGFIGYRNPLTDEFDITSYTNAVYFQSQGTVQIIPKKLRAQFNYKYNAKVPIYILPETEEEPVLEYSEGFHWMNISLGYSFNERFSILGTVKNALNVSNVSTPRLGGPIHGTGGVQAIGYGRSFALKLNYSIHKT